MRRRRWRVWQWLPLLMVGGALAGCALLKPLPKQTSLGQRLAMLPTDGLPLDAPVTIRWDEHQIPFIEAATDDDAAFALGLVHAHLRLGQMAVYRRVAQGRVSEMGGPLARRHRPRSPHPRFRAGVASESGGYAASDAAVAAALCRWD